nr:hypothetical protein B0A51_09533 [Rachicladosporium sp. CCFEE 5018]
MATPQLRSPRFPDPPQPSHQLIELLDQYLELKGVIFPRSDATSETTIDAKDDGASSPSDLLSTHLDEHDNDLARATALEPLIYQVHKSLDRHIRQATLDHLDHLYSELADRVRVEVIEGEGGGGEGGQGGGGEDGENG